MLYLTKYCNTKVNERDVNCIILKGTIPKDSIWIRLKKMVSLGGLLNLNCQVLSKVKKVLVHALTGHPSWLVRFQNKALFVGRALLGVGS